MTPWEPLTPPVWWNISAFAPWYITRAEHYSAVFLPLSPMKNQNWCTKHMCPLLNSSTGQSGNDAETSHSWWSWNIRHSWEQNTKPFPPLSPIFHQARCHLSSYWSNVEETECQCKLFTHLFIIKIMFNIIVTLLVISLRGHKSIMLTCSRPKNLIWFYWMNMEGGYEENSLGKKLI